MRGDRKLYLILTLGLLAGGGCSTSPRPFETPAGPRSADQFGEMKILGVISRFTSTGRRPNARTPFTESVVVNVPPGTDLIVPAVRGWMTGFGHTIPEDLSPDTPGQWVPADTEFGFLSIHVVVKDINAVDNSTTPPTQTAEILVIATLADYNSQDEWWGGVAYTLICLGKVPQTMDRPPPR